MKSVATLFAALAIAATTFAAPPAFAKGGGSDLAEERAKLQRELREARENGGSSSGSSFFGSLFGSDDSEVAEKPAKTE